MELYGEKVISRYDKTLTSEVFINIFSIQDMKKILGFGFWTNYKLITVCNCPWVSSIYHLIFAHRNTFLNLIYYLSYKK